MPSKPKTFKPPHAQTKAEKDKQRPNATERGYDYAYRKLRDAYVLEHPLCVDCLKDGKVTLVEHVHHDDKIVDNFDQRLDITKWISLCASHHRLRHSGDGHTVWNRRKK